MKATFFFVFVTIFSVFGDDHDLAQKIADLKKQAVRILELSGKPVKADKYHPKPGIGWDDVQMTEKVYKSLKKNFDIEEAAKLGGGDDRVASPDFDLLPFERWPFPIEYRLQDVWDDELKDIIRATLNEIETKTCIRFQESDGPEGPHINYVQADVPNICGDSPLGRQPEQNRIRMVCKEYGTALHETLHSLGFGHTQTRPDADQYVYIHWDNINPDYQFNFKPWQFARTDQGEYDYGSIMHYSKQGFAIDPNQNTMDAIVDPEVNTDRMGQRTGLSELDAQEMNRVYCGDQDVDPNQYGDVASKSHKNGTSAAGKKNSKATQKNLKDGWNGGHQSTIRCLSRD